jgi:hypothetical protein
MLCQTTDSGSNNKTMAQEMHKQFLEQDGLSSYKWDPHTMHIFCFCHKLALIVNAGLAALGVKAPPPLKVKQSDRGHFPIIETITEEEEEEEESDEPQVIPATSSVPSRSELVEDDEDIVEHDVQDLETPPEDVAELDDEGEWDAADAEDEECPEAALLEENEVQPTHRRQANQVDYVLRKVRRLRTILTLFNLIIVLFSYLCFVCDLINRSTSLLGELLVPQPGARSSKE